MTNRERAMVEARDRRHELVISRFREEVARLEAEIVGLKSHIRTLVAERNDEIWLWQSDGGNDVESLACPVLIQPADLRALISLAEANEDCAAPVEREPDGWIASFTGPHIGGTAYFVSLERTETFNRPVYFDDLARTQETKTDD